jgi:hypothetical protein
MAVEIRVWCDRCGDRITQERVTLKPTTGKLRHREPFDLCASCSDQLVDWFGPIVGRKEPEPGRPAESASTTPVPPPPGDPSWTPAKVG